MKLKKPKQEKKVLSKIFAGVIEWKDNKKKLKLNSPDWYAYQLSKFKVGEKVWLYLDGSKPKRSLQQNNFLHLYNSIIRREMDDSYTHNELHHLFKIYCMPEKYKPYKQTIMGKEILMTHSTATLGKSDFCELLLNISEFTKIPIPSTEEWNPKFYKNTIKDYPQNNLGETSF